MIRVALIGYGYAGKTFHAPLIRAISGLELCLIGSSKRDELATRFPDVEVCTPEIAAVHSHVDLVVIATPNDSHFPLASAALRAGKHVVLDKPFTVTLAEARALARLAAEHARLLSVFHNRRWDSEILAAREVLASGVLGEVSHYECHMDRYRPLVRERWRENPGLGAGLWFDLGPHMIDQALYLFGLPAAVNGSFATLRRGGRTEDWSHVQLLYEQHGRDTLRVILHCTLLAAPGSARSLLHGTRGSWWKFGADVQEGQLAAGMDPNDAAFGLDPDRGILVDGASGERTELVSPRGHQQAYYEEIRDAINEAREPHLSVIDAVANMAVLQASIESGASGTVLPIPLTDAERTQWYDRNRRR